MWYGVFLSTESHSFVYYYRRGNWAVIGVYILMLAVFTYILGGYKVGYLKITETFVSHVIAILCCNILEYFQLCINFHVYVNVIPVLVMTLIEIIVLVPWVFVTRRMYVSLYPAKQMLYVYGSHQQMDLVEKISTRDDKYSIAGMISVKEGLPAVYEKMEKYEAVIIGDMSAKQRNCILKHSFDKNIRAYVIPKISDLILMGATEINLFDTQLFLARNYGLSAEQLYMKRAMDIILSLCGLIVLSPVMLVIAILIKAYDRGPVLYRQTRLTLNGKTFEMLKFRSMYQNAEKDAIRLMSKDDQRVTPVGRVIRRIHLDELPQLFNVLKGDMSFVGPRPERPEIAEVYSQEIPEFRYRLKIKAGLTGYAQVYGKYNSTPYDKLKLDLTYIEKYSLWLDIKIILLTGKILFVPEHVEGVETDSLTALKQEESVTGLERNQEHEEDKSLTSK